MKRLFLVLTLIVCFFQISNLKAQDACGTESTDFWVAFMPNYIPSQSKTTLHISSRFNTTGSVFIGGVLLQNFTVNAGAVLEIPIDAINTPSTSGLVEAKGIQVTSDNIITLYAENAQRASSDASLIFPTNTLGKVYYPMCYTSLITSEFVIVATQDNTQVTITPTVNTDDGEIANTPFTIVLNKAQTYMLQASGSDLTGSKIVSDKAIAVFSGNVCANVPDGVTWCDHLYEQVPPLDAWGKNFVTSPLATRGYDVFRILASKNNTNVTRNGVFFATLNEGEFVEFTTDGNNVAQVVEADEPIILAQYSIGKLADGLGDPGMMILTPSELTLTNTVFETFPLVTTTTHYVNVVTKTTNTTNVLLDGGAIITWVSIAGTDLSYSQTNLLDGIHTLSSTSGEGFISYVYGFADADSYAYAGGMGLPKPLSLGVGGADIECSGDVVRLSPGDNFSGYVWSTGETTASIDVTSSGEYWVQADCTIRDTISVTFTPNLFDDFKTTLITDCGNSPFVKLEDITSGATVFNWDFGDGNTSILANPPQFKYANDGIYTITLEAGDGVCMRTTSATIIVETEELPIPDFTISLTEFCGTMPLVELTNLSSGSTVFNWDFGDGRSSNSENPPDFQYINTGTYTITLEVSNSNGICTQSISKDVQIDYNPVPLAKLKDSLLIECGKLPFVELINLSSASTVFNWDFGDGTSSTLENPPLFKYADDGTYTITLVASNPLCPLQISSASTIVIVTGSPPNDAPVLTAVLPFNSATQCYETAIAIGDDLYFELFADDSDGDSLAIFGEGIGFSMTSAGMLLSSPHTLPIMSASFSWSPTCDLLPNGLDSVVYELTFLAKDTKECNRFSKTSDEVCVKILLHRPPNTAPIVSSSLLYDAVTDIYYDSLEINNHFTFEFDIEDVDGDSLTIDFTATDGFTMSILSATFTPTSGSNGLLTARFDWDIFCTDLIPITSASRTEYFFDAIIKDYDLCGYNQHTDTTRIKLILLPNINTEPVITTSLDYDVVSDIYFDSLEINNHFAFNFDLFDADNDSLTIDFFGDGFDMTSAGATFSPTSGRTLTNSQFDWDIFCEDLIPVTSADTTEYFFKAIIRDYDLCDNVRDIDTVTIKLVLLPNPNTEPIHSSSLVYDVPNDIYRDSVIVTKATTFTFDIFDGNTDFLTLELEGRGFDMTSAGMTFTPNSGTGIINATFDWQTDCNYLVNNNETLYIFDAIIKDYDICGNIRSTDTTEFQILVRPIRDGDIAKITSDSLEYDTVNEIFFDTLTVLEAKRFDLKGTDPEGGTIFLDIVGDGFTLASIDATFQTVTNPDNTIDGDFNWQTVCNTLNPSTDTTTYFFHAIIQDFDICVGEYFSDTTQVRLTVLPIINPVPLVDSAGVSDLVYDAIRDIYTTEVFFGDTLEFDMMGDDSDGDIITLSASGLNFDMTELEMEFQPIRDLPRVESHFKWVTGCNILDKVDYTEPYVVEFQVADEGNCAADSVNTKRVEITLKEVPNDIPEIYIENPIASGTCYEMRVVVGDTLNFDVLATDLNQDDVTISGSIKDFTFSELGMNFTSVTGVPASLPLSSEFVWVTNFDILEDYQDSVTYELNFVADDRGCETAEICVKITLVNCQTPDLAGIPAISNLCSAGDTLGREIPQNSEWTYWWTSDVGIEGDSTQRLIYVKKAGIYTIHVQHLADHCIYESRTIVRTDDLFLEAQDTIICQSEAPVNLIARDLAHPSNFIYEWRNLLDTSVIVQSDTSGLLEVDSSGVYLVKMTNPNGGCFTTDTVQATINPNPSFDIVGYENPVCKEAVNLQIENTNITGFQVQWSVQAVDSTGYFEGSTDNLTVRVLKSGLYTATVTDTATNCETSKQLEIIINDNPQINLNPSLQDTLICQDTDFIVDAFDVSHPIDATYQWKNLSSNQTVSDSSKLIIEFANFDKTAYEVTISNPISTCQSKDTIQVAFVRQAIAEITANKTGICLGDSITLSANGGDSFLWNNGDTTESITISPQEVGIYTYILEAQYQNACAASFDTIQLEVSPVPLLNIPSYVGACQEDTTAFLDARHSSHTFNSTYKWYWIGDTTSLSDSSRIDLKFDAFQNQGFDALSPFDLVVEVSNSQNACFATDTVKIEFSKSSLAKIDTLFDQEICLGETIILQGSGGDSLYWNTGDSTNTIRITPEKVGFERIILFANNLNACAETSDTVFVKVNPLPVIDLHELDSITVCYGDTLLLTPTGGDSGRYVWEHLPSPADTLFVSPEITTTYYVFGTDSNGCQGSDSLKVIVRPTLDLPEEMQACVGDFLEIGAESPVEAEYYWLQGGFTTPTIKVKASGTYSVRVTTAECVYERSVEVKFAEYPELESTKDTTFCFEFGAEDDFADGKTHFINTVITNPDTAANYNYVWLDTAGFVVGVTDSLEVGEEGVYVVQVFDEKLENTCPSTDTVRIEAVCEPRIFIPTGFSPNGDELNDRFTIFGKHIKNFKMEVHDRWGALIYVLEREDFEDIQENEFWDGTLKGQPLPSGMYTWSIQYENPFKLKAETVNLNGKIDIVR